ncbi:PA14 domain-containing protein [Hymenobacter sublimis]|uniref:PA14 domain-containing protein n=1 Tax=Hymenobacter sublimis TaxID=2933777 RepID=A0ABY4JBI6_9BACT|nr:PA14 domain-containing protein [Hymenobacter sublimis]UPL49308.1 PA14 domain-containing protein [Hymenobacter sublimis]
MKYFFSSCKHYWLVVLLCGLWWLPAQKAQAQAGGCSGTDPAGQAATTGLYAEYFSRYFADDTGFFSDNANPAGLRRVEAQVNFPTAASFGDLRPISEGTAQDPDRYSLRLRGSLNIATTGTYTFYLTSDDAAYLWLDNEATAIPPNPDVALIAIQGSRPALTRTATVTLTAGRHNVQILYGDDCCENVLVWEYEGPGIARQVVPSSVLCTGLVPVPPVPQSISYSPAARAFPAGTTLSSGTPVVQAGGAAPTGFAIANVAALPAGISINSATGVLTASGSVPQGSYDVAVAVTNANGTSTFRNVFRFTVTAPLPTGCGGTDPGGQTAAAGLYSEYFSGFFDDDPNFFTGLTPGLVRTDAHINFPLEDSFGNLLPVATGSQTAPDNFSLRQRGSLYLAATGTYTFYLTADDAAYLWLDNAALASPLVLANATINNGGVHSAKTVAVTLKLSAGLHNIALLYGDKGVGNTLLLEYESADLSLARTVVPSSLFCTSVQPLLPLAVALNYSPATLRVATGRSGTSVAPTATSSSAVVEYLISNAADLPAGITINSATGQLSVSAGVAEGSYAVSVAARNSGGTAVFAQVLTVQVVAAAPVGCAGVDANSAVATSGLFVEYFPGYFNDDLTFFSSTAATRTNRTQAIDFSSAASWSEITGQQDPDGFSARFRGRILVPTTGTYTLHLTSDDAAYLWLDNAALASSPTPGTALISNSGIHEATTKSGVVNLTAGLHDILILYGEAVGPNVLRLEYESADANVSRQLVSAGSLCTTLSNAPLPVTLIRFGVQPTKTGVVTSWETSQELNSATFVVERSANGQVFEPIGRVAAAGTTQQRQLYSFTDRAPFAGQNYYRLRQLDKDGTAHLSGVVNTQWNASANGLQLTLFPNPTATGTCTVRLEQAAATATQLQVLDLTGRTVYRQQLPAASTTEHTFPTRQLRPGVYMVRVTSAQGTVTQRIEVQ